MDATQQQILHDFPSLAWLEALRDGMNSSPERYRKIGTADSRFLITVEREDGETHFGVVLSDYECEDVSDVEDAEAFEADFRIRGPEAAWREMVENIVSHGKADREHTLNRLTLIRRPLEVQRTATMTEFEKFFQYNYTLQSFFDELGAGKPVVAV